MNLFAPVSSLMTHHQDLVIVTPDDTLAHIKDIFDTHSFHHIPVVRFREIVGIVSKLDFEHIMGNIESNNYKFLVDRRLEHIKASDIMTTRLGKIESTDRLNVAVEIFTINRFHALPVVDNHELVGIITPYDILKKLSEERPADPSSVYENSSAL